MNARTSISLPNSSFYPMFTWFSTITQVTNFYNPFFSLHVQVSSGRFSSLREYIEFPSHVRKIKFDMFQINKKTYFLNKEPPPPKKIYLCRVLFGQFGVNKRVLYVGLWYLDLI